ncbi:MAG: AAA family ATPase [Nitrospira sp.]|nr:AAA family ATPase [Nitrospira sp.]HNP28092.1 AAA family ATPase [Nitrospirales bacterium]
MSDSSEFSPSTDSSRSGGSPFPKSPRQSGSTPLHLLDQCLASLPEGDTRIPLLYQLRHRLVEQTTASQQQEADMKKIQGVLEKLTAPANRIGTLLGQPDKGVARIMVGGAEYYANVDPRLEGEDLKVGHQILVNEAYVVIRSLGYDRSGPIVKVREILGDGRLRIDQEAGRQGILIQRADDLASADLKVGDEVRLDPTHRIAIERLENPQDRSHLLAELPTVRWEHIGGQQEAIGAIRRSIEYPLLHEELFTRYQFQQPKGFLLYGPPGCGKTLIGQATAASLGQLFAQEREVITPQVESQDQDSLSRLPPIEGGVFLHVKGPEVLNMWVGESERIIRDLFLQARQQRQAGKLPFIFIDEAESILGTRRAVRSYNVSNTLVPMFCAELDGIESLSQVVVILASNRPDMIDPAVLRPGRIDRKIKVGRPGRNDVGEILRVYLTADLPYDTKNAASSGEDHGNPLPRIIDGLLENLFQRSQENRVLAIRLRNGRREILYRRDLLSGAVLAGIVRRAKERAIERAIQAGDQDPSGLSLDDLLIATNDEFKESEIFPPDDSAEEWLKLLDYHPDQVVGVSSLQPGKDGAEHRTSQIV